ncbi:Brp/Blh family beta-carotene 15,15'-dioxygenase [Winogradskyella sp.]
MTDKLSFAITTFLNFELNGFKQEYLSYFLILTVGVIHGSNDLALLKHIKADKKWLKKPLLFYNGLIYVCILIFFFNPILAFTVFMLASCYHFGEQHFHNKMISSNVLSRLLYFSYGSMIFSLLFYFNKEEVSTVVLQFLDFDFSFTIFNYLVVFSLVLTVLLYVLSLNNLRETSRHLHEILLILIFALLFKYVSLLWGFTIYFIFWHSIPSIRDQIKIMFGDVNRMNYYQYFKSSFLYWILSLVITVILYFYCITYSINLNTILFTFLTSIIVSHVIVMSFVNRK